MSGGHEHPDDAFAHPERYERVARLGFLGGRDRVYRRLAALAMPVPGEQVLDLGCGSGGLSRAFADLLGDPAAVTGIDPSPAMVDYCANRLPGARFATMSATELDLPAASFDVVASSLALHHIDPDQHPQVLAEAARVLRPGGRLLLIELARPPQLHEPGSGHSHESGRQGRPDSASGHGHGPGPTHLHGPVAWLRRRRSGVSTPRAGSRLPRLLSEHGWQVVEADRHLNLLYAMVARRP